jgi:hypothetical protein
LYMYVFMNDFKTTIFVAGKDMYDIRKLDSYESQ